MTLAPIVIQDSKNKWWWWNVAGGLYSTGWPGDKMAPKVQYG